MVVILADLQEFSYSEIAEILDVPVGTVMSRLYRGRRLLQKALAGYAALSGVVRPPSVPARRWTWRSSGAGETRAGLPSRLAVRRHEPWSANPPT